MKKPVESGNEVSCGSFLLPVFLISPQHTTEGIMRNTCVRKALSVVSIAMFALVFCPPPLDASQPTGSSQDRQFAAAIRSSVIPSDPGDDYFSAIYRDFYNSYKPGPDDKLALQVKGQTDYSPEEVTVSPVGRINHPLLGDVDVAGMTVPGLADKLGSGRKLRAAGRRHNHRTRQHEKEGGEHRLAVRFLELSVV